MSDPTPLYSSAEAANTLSQSQILHFVNNRPPVLREGIFLASIPYSYDLNLIRKLRQRDDGRDQKLVDWLVKKLSFVQPIPNDESEHVHYRMDEDERELLQKHWLESDPNAYVEAHQRALAFWEDYPVQDPFIQRQNTLYHLMIIDPMAGIHLLARTFRQYANQRHLAAIDRLLDIAKTARSFLAFRPNLPVLEGSRGWNLAYLDSWLHYLHARLAQLRKQWLQSEPTLLMLLENDTLPKVLFPYVVRAYALVLSKKGQYVEAIEQFEFAAQAFAQQLGMEDQQAYTMISLGDTYVELAITARGDRARLVPLEMDWQERVGGIFSLPLVLPLVAYLSVQGINLWHPRSWPTLQKQDWIIARLFGHATKWYQQANDLLEAISGRSEWWGRPEEKLAWLYLQLGEAEQAKLFFEELLADDVAPLSEYTLATVQVGLARSRLQLGEPSETSSLINKALPALEKYEDVEFQAQAHQLLAEAYLMQNRLAEAIPHFEQALKAYQRLHDLVGATDIVERLQEIQHEEVIPVTDEEVAVISNITQLLPVREYLVRFQHPTLVFFRRVMMIALATSLFIVSMQTVYVAPIELIQNTEMFAQTDQFWGLNVSASLQESMTSLAIYRSLPFRLLVLLFDVSIITLFYMFLGAYMIGRTEWNTVQTMTRSKAIRMDKEGITIGYSYPESIRSIRWVDVTHVVIADMRWWLRPMRNHAGMILTNQQQQFVLQANATWYESLKRHVPEWLAARQDQGRAVQKVDLSYTLLRSKMGLLYGSGLLLLLGLAIAYELWPTTIEQNLFGTAYSVLDLYPYLFLTLFLPPVWWGVIQPLYMLARIGRHQPLLHWVVRLGVILGLLRLLTYSQTWFLYPDIYPSLTILALLGNAILTFRWAAHPIIPPPTVRKTDRLRKLIHSYRRDFASLGSHNWLKWYRQTRPLWRLLMILLILWIITGAVLRLVQDIYIYHYLILDFAEGVLDFRFQISDFRFGGFAEILWRPT